MATIRNLMIRLGVEVDGRAESNLSKFEKNVAKIGSVVASAFAVDKIIDFGKEAFAEAQEAQKVGAVTTQVIKSTGGAAKVTADHIGDLAARISQKVGIDDEAIQSGENLLLTFTNIRNETGRGNKIFDIATQAITDMSAAMGVSMKTAAIQVGKALNDPIKGLGALQRVGVSFTAGQKEQIKAMVASGNVMGAQKLILAELKKEFGGAAAAMATPADKAAVAWGNFKEAVGTALLPIINKVFNFLNTTGVPTLQKILTWIQSNTNTVKNLGIALGALYLAYKVASTITTIFAGAQVALKIALAGVNAVAATARGVWAGFVAVQRLASAACLGTRIQLAALALQERLAAVGTRLLVAAQIAGGAASKVFAVGVRLLNAAMRANPIGIVITILTVLIGIIVLAYKKNETFRNIVNRVWAFIKTFIVLNIKTIIQMVKILINWFTNTLPNALRTMQRWISSVWNSVTGFIKRVIDKIVGYFNVVKKWVTQTVPNAFKAGVAAIGRAWNKVMEVAKKPVSFIINTVYNNGIARVWNWVSDKIGGGLGHLNPIKGFATGGKINQGTGPKSDDVLIRASRGEYIIDAATTMKNLGLLSFMRGKKRDVLPDLIKNGLSNPPGLPGFAEGGIIGWVKAFAAKAKNFFIDGLVAAGRAVLRPIVALTKRTIGGTPWGRALAGLVERIGEGMLARFKPLEAATGGPGISRGLAFARSQQGKPYIWGGVGPRGYDCSGFMSAITNVVHGKSPYSRLFSTHSFGATGGPGGFVRNLRSGFMVGVTNAGVGHMAGTIKGVNVESRGSRGVVVGSAARGFNNPLFGYHYGLKLDDGGVLPPGTGTFVNKTHKPEYVFTQRQIRSMGNGDHFEINITVAPGADVRAFENAVYAAIKKYKQRNGRKLSV